jgi:hypothetical protein
MYRCTVLPPYTCKRQMSSVELKLAFAKPDLDKAATWCLVPTIHILGYTTADFVIEGLPQGKLASNLECIPCGPQDVPRE